jgi:hypothetical protein
MRRGVALLGLAAVAAWCAAPSAWQDRRAAPPLVQTKAKPPFEDVAEDVGLRFVHEAGAAGQYALPEVMGAGVALLDYDGDGDLDVFLVQGGTLADGTGHGAAGSRLFRNELRKDDPRSLRFTDVTPKTGFAPHGYGMGAATGDYDGDGDLDIYVTAFGRNVLYRNDGSGTLTDVTDAAGVDDPRWSTSAAFLDYDRDGDLDLFVANYLAFTLAANKVCTDASGAHDYCGPLAYRPVPARLFRNEGRGRFADVSDLAGIARAFGAGLGVSVGDYNGDGWLDLYVANDATPNQLWLNQRNGTFADDGLLAGVAVNAAGVPEGSMGIASGDYDADGDEDLFVTNIVGETHVLYANDGAGSFEDARVRAGTVAPTAAMTGFGTAWLDVDHDGWLDLFVANGAVNTIAAQRGTPLPFRMHNLLLRNAGDRRLVDVTATSGAAFSRMDIGRGTATGDLDNDGDLDLVVTNNRGPVRVLRNTLDGAQSWLQVSVAAPAGNRFAFGARVGILREGRPTLWRRVGSDGSYLSASDVRLHVGLGSASRATGVVVQWPDGIAERFGALPGKARHVLVRGSGQTQGH